MILAHLDDDHKSRLREDVANHQQADDLRVLLESRNFVHDMKATARATDIMVQLVANIVLVLSLGKLLAARHPSMDDRSVAASPRARAPSKSMQLKTHAFSPASVAAASAIPIYWLLVALRRFLTMGKV